MNRLKHLVLASLVAFAACESPTEIPDPLEARATESDWHHFPVTVFDGCRDIFESGSYALHQTVKDVEENGGGFVTYRHFNFKGTITSVEGTIYQNNGQGKSTFHLMEDGSFVFDSSQRWHLVSRGKALNYFVEADLYMVFDGGVFTSSSVIMTSCRGAG